MAKATIKFDPLEVPGLLEKAKAGDIVARDELLERFGRLGSTLVHVCITGRPNFWSSYQKTFLQMFASKTTPITETAMMLKKQLIHYEADELFRTAQLAILQAIERCETNLASTIVICFKDLIFSMIKGDRVNNVELNEALAVEYYNSEDEIALNMFYETLNEMELEVVDSILSGESVAIPASLKKKFETYMKEPSE